MDLNELKDGRELRFDVGALRSRGRRTPQGFLRVPGNLTRTGVLTYHRADGSRFRELRHPDEVFKADSLGSLAFAPVTEGHPGGLVTPKNVAKVQVGIVTGAREDGRFIAGDLVVQSDPTIANVLGGKTKECSPGYTCRIDHTAGEWEGERYDGIQRGIVYNHLAIGPRDWGRSGNEVQLHLDGVDAELAHLIGVEHADSWTMLGSDEPPGDPMHTRFDQSRLGDFLRTRAQEQEVTIAQMASAAGISEATMNSILAGDIASPPDRRLRGLARVLGVSFGRLKGLIPTAATAAAAFARGDGDTMETRTIRVDGLSYDVPSNAAAAIEKHLSNLESEVQLQTTRADSAEGKLDGVTKERDELKTKLDDATDPKEISKAVAARVTLEKGARKVLGLEVKLDGKTDLEVKVAVLTKSDSNFDPGGKSEDYVNGRFDHVVASAPEPNSRRAVASAIAQSRDPNANRQDADDDQIVTVEDAKAKARADAAALGSKPLRVSII